MTLVISQTFSLNFILNFRMADNQDFNILDYEYNLRGDDLLGPRDQDEEPMDQGDSNCLILEEEDD